MTHKEALAAIIAAWDQPHYGDMDAASDSLFEPIEAARRLLEAPAPQIYVWSSEACRNYGPGTVAAIGETVDEARGRGFSALIDWAREDRSWLFEPDGSVSEDFKEEWDSLREKITNDLYAEPKTMAALVVTGSE